DPRFYAARLADYAAGRASGGETAGVSLPAQVPADGAQPQGLPGVGPGIGQSFQCRYRAVQPTLPDRPPDGAVAPGDSWQSGQYFVTSERLLPGGLHASRIADDGRGHQR